MSFDLYIMQDIADRFAVLNMAGLFGASPSMASMGSIGGLASMGSNGGLAAFGSAAGLASIGEGTQDSSGLPRTSRMSRMTGRKSRMMKTRPQSVSYGLANLGMGTSSSPHPELLVLTSHKDYGPVYNVFTVKDDFEGLRAKVPEGNGIDGVYLEYEPEMLEPDGRMSMLKLAESYTVGVWMLKPRDPDSLSVARRLVGECGVSFVNTDFLRPAGNAPDFFNT